MNVVIFLTNRHANSLQPMRRPVKQSTILEENKRLSESVLWDMQSSAYCQFGPEAWSHKGVPSYVTSNPFTVREYVEVVVGYIRDCLSPDAATPINLNEPIYIFDLGAGTGRFADLFLKTLTEYLNLPALKDVKLCYVMTDIAEKNIAFWQTHPSLRPYIEFGLLDFAYYHHAEQEKPLNLILSDQSLSKDDIVNPVMLIANYFFDTIPQDLFRLNNGKLEEGLISIKVEPVKDIGDIIPTNPKIIPHMSCSYSYEPIKNAAHYYDGFPELNNLLKIYSKQFDNIPFLFPFGAFQSIRYFSELSQNRLCLVAGDQGVCSTEQIVNWGEPKISKHGTFSIPVSYHAIANYFTEQGGASLLTTFPDPQFVVMTGILGGDISHYAETQLAYRSHIDSFEPCDYWKIVNCAEKESQDLSLDYMLLLLKLGNWDPMVFNSFYTKLRAFIPLLSNEEKQKLIAVIDKVWEKFYPVGNEGGNFIMNLGVLLFEIGDFKKALIYFKHALDLMGQQPQILQNIAACIKAIKAQ